MASNDDQNKPARDIISEKKKASINREFPGQYFDKTIAEIEAAKKLLTYSRFKKEDNRK